MAEVVLLALEEIAHLLDRPWRHLASGDAILVHEREVDVERRDERNIALEHEVDALVIDQVAVLDAGNAGVESVLDAGRPFGVGQRAADACRARLLDDRPNLLNRELRGIGRVSGG